MYLVGIDGGGTKTKCVIGDQKGNILSEGYGGNANYQICGEKVAKDSIVSALQEAMNKINISLDDIEYSVLGLAGADDDMDYKILNKICKSIFMNVPFEVFNDCFIGLRSGSQDNWGVISICGTGAAYAGRSRDGEEVILRNMDYMLGNKGGGSELVEHALHYAFRSNENTGDKTILENTIPKLFQVKDMSDVYNHIRTKGLTEEQLFNIPIDLFDAADMRDRVAQNIVINMGITAGEYTNAVIRKLGFQDKKVPVILIGSVFKTRNPLLLTAYSLSVYKEASKADIIIPDIDPVMGAYYLAVDKKKGIVI
ncbi:N-acetylmuramic acid/N-acetylglucosamine kinase [Vallitalea longa]|uniref:N-acetylmuramic acid/N-acetylglucosamine kinase n=1 Tax=Vallitalea longa TaxID=2936439 RepID=A0A9W5YIA9_9FIRM|nr:BadF/BadG/BcrA/BcrD ATPase family protein [Vallitalea longa]GKX31798.1 N-acetylmuramic acid/N-acetylglucosamine kinase [Vallitalea longa]